MSYLRRVMDALRRKRSAVPEECEDERMTREVEEQLEANPPKPRRYFKQDDDK